MPDMWNSEMSKTQSLPSRNSQPPSLLFLVLVRLTKVFKERPLLRFRIHIMEDCVMRYIQQTGSQSSISTTRTVINRELSSFPQNHPKHVHVHRFSSGYIICEQQGEFSPSCKWADRVKAPLQNPSFETNPWFL